MATRRRAFGVGATAMLVVVALGGALGVYAKHVWPKQTRHQAVQYALSGWRKIVLGCSQGRPYSGTPLALHECDAPVGNGAPQFLVWGDSHASHLVPMLTELSRKRGTSVRMRFMPECPPLQDYLPIFDGVNHAPGCDAFNRDVLSEIASLQRHGLSTVIIGARWWAYAHGSQASQSVEAGLRSTLLRLQRLGIRTLVAAPVPEFPYEVPPCLARRSPTECGASRFAIEQKREPIMALLASTARDFPLVTILDPLQVLCPDSYCRPINEKVVLFSDSHHLTEGGSLVLLPLYAAQVDSMGAGENSAPNETTATKASDE